MHDVIIIGSGIAGLVSAIKLAEHGLKVLIISKYQLNECNSNLAQGGIVYSSDKYLVDDIMKASAGTTLEAAANIIQSLGPNILQEILLDKCQTEFTSKNKKLLFTKEAAHSRARIIYRGDYTGKSIVDSLIRYIKKFRNIEVKEFSMAVDLIVPRRHSSSIADRYLEDRVIGAYIWDGQKVRKFISKIVVLATGGVTALYANTTSLRGMLGHGHAMAMRAGAILCNMEFIQFHPTTFFEQNFERRFLISEVLRGEGAKLRNCRGNRFMKNYHKDGELAARDIVARSIILEMRKTRGKCVFLDITGLKRKYLRERFPNIFDYCLCRGIDISKDYIPVVPAAHYTCGGIKTDLYGRSNIAGLYAIGEVACTGLHGANRLASTSLLEGLVFAYIAAVDIAAKIDALSSYIGPIDDFLIGKGNNYQVDQDIRTIRQTMWNYVGIFRSDKGLSRALHLLNSLESQIDSYYGGVTSDVIELKNSIEVARCIVKASMENRQSIGCLFRE
jgi:L-aspartate oxidase